MNNTQFNNLVKLHKQDIFSADISPAFYSFDINPYVMIKKLSFMQRKTFAYIVSTCHNLCEKLDISHHGIALTKKNELVDNLISNIMYIFKTGYSNDFNAVVKGICVTILRLKEIDHSYLSQLQDILSFDEIIKNLNNIDLLSSYKITFREYIKDSSVLYSEDCYKDITNNNLILEIKRQCILKELKDRCKYGKTCDILDRNNIYQGDGNFIPKKSSDDEMIILFKDMPYTLNGFKNTGLSTKKVNNKICWK